ncbi:MAG: hypothetical protein H6760_02905 [Candidatus Nomurabacteria bacterium]|nr:MAG: hypothetical protein H6760_02905 [Candidatus Nomurabacteria bacterium]
MTYYDRTTQQSTISQRLAGTLLRTLKLRLTAITVLTVTLAVIGGGAYLALINNVATTGFEIKTLENRVDELRKENRRLEVEATELQSLSAVQEASGQLGLTEVAHIEYLSPTDSAFARR